MKKTSFEHFKPTTAGLNMGLGYEPFGSNYTAVSEQIPVYGYGNGNSKLSDTEFSYIPLKLSETSQAPTFIESSYIPSKFEHQQQIQKLSGISQVPTFIATSLLPKQQQIVPPVFTNPYMCYCCHCNRNGTETQNIQNDTVPVTQETNVPTPVTKESNDSLMTSNLLSNVHLLDTNSKLIQRLIETYKDKIDWKKLSSNQLSKEFISKFFTYIDWASMVKCYNNFETLLEILNEYSDRIDWSVITKNIILSEQVIKNFSNRLVWEVITDNPTFRETFIELCSDKIDYSKIQLINESNFPNFSIDFIEKNIDKLNISDDTLVKITNTMVPWKIETIEIDYPMSSDLRPIPEPTRV